MNMNLHQRGRALRAGLSIAAVVGVAAFAVAASSVSPDHKFAWQENVGWTNWRDANDAADGVRLHKSFLSGFAWGENIGWINFGIEAPPGGNYSNTDGSTFGVNVDSSTGACSGLAWGENVGWINFSTTSALGALGARYDTASGKFRGYAWGENIGWLNLEDSSLFVCGLIQDLNADGRIDANDLAVLLSQFGMFVPNYSGADMDGDGQVTTYDLALMLRYFGQSCPK